RHGLSHDQTVWVHVLAMETLTPGPAADADQLAIPLTGSAADMAGMVGLFRAAATHLKWPKVRLIAGDVPVVLSLYGDRSRYQGQIRVTDDRPFESQRWYGRVDDGGA